MVAFDFSWNVDFRLLTVKFEHVVQKLVVFLKNVDNFLSLHEFL